MTYNVSMGTLIFAHSLTRYTKQIAIQLDPSHHFANVRDLYNQYS